MSLGTEKADEFEEVLIFVELGIGFLEVDWFFYEWLTSSWFCLCLSDQLQVCVFICV